MINLERRSFEQFPNVREKLNGLGAELERTYSKHLQAIALAGEGSFSKVVPVFVEDTQYDVNAIKLGAGAMFSLFTQVGDALQDRMLVELKLDKDLEKIESVTCSIITYRSESRKKDVWTSINSEEGLVNIDQVVTPIPGRHILSEQQRFSFSASNLSSEVVWTLGEKKHRILTIEGNQLSSDEQISFTNKGGRRINTPLRDVLFPGVDDFVARAIVSAARNEPIRIEK